MPDLSSGNKERLVKFRQAALAKRQQLAAEHEHAEANLDEIREELKATAYNLGISIEDLARLLTYGERGSEAMDILRNGRASSVDEALAQVWKDAGDEAGEVIDEWQRQYNRRPRGGPDPIAQAAQEDWRAIHPARRHHKRGKAEISEWAELYRWLEKDSGFEE